MLWKSPLLGNRPVRAVTGLALLAAAGAASAQQNKDVNVVNTPGVTVVNTPSVNVANTPTVNARQAGAWTVQIGGAPAVTLANPVVQVGNSSGNPVPVRNVDAPAPEPFQAGDTYNIPVGASYADNTLAFVPAGKRLVIEFVSAGGPSGGTAGLALLTTVNGTTVQHGLLLGSNAYTASQPVRLYADGGTAVVGRIFTSQPADSGWGSRFAISGYLVDAP